MNFTSGSESFETTGVPKKPVTPPKANPIKVDENIDSIKIMVLGDPAVGKTSLLVSYCSNEFPRDYNPTVFDNYTANCVYEGRIMALGLWDTAGTDSYGELRPLSFPDTHIFVVVYSISSKESLDSVCKKWIPEIKSHTQGIPIFLVGNKLDIRQNLQETANLTGSHISHSFSKSSSFGSNSGIITLDDCVTTEEGLQMMKKVGATGFAEVSAKTQENLNDCFQLIIQSVFEKIPSNNKEEESDEKKKAQKKLNKKKKAGCKVD